MQSKRFFPVALLGAALLGACADDPTGPRVAPPTPEAPRALGFVEIRISGIGTPQMSASVSPLGGGALGDLTPIPGGSPAGSIQVSRLSATTVDVGTRGAGGQRYLQAVFQVRNADGTGTAYTTPRQNLTFIPVSTASTISGTPVRHFLKQDGTGADAGIAAQLRPTGAVALDGGGALVSQYPDVLQAFTEGEASAFTLPPAVTNRFPYGFVVRHATETGTRTLPASPAEGQFDGRVTFAYRIPLAATAAEDPFTISILAVAMDDSDTRMTQSPEEQSAAGRSAFEARATALGATAVTIFPGGAYTGSAAKRMLCGVRTAGESGSPAATLSPCPEIASVAVSPANPVRLANEASRLVGQTVQLSATITDVNGQAAEWASATWSSSNTSVATVSSSGLVTFAGTGTATITATAGGKSGTATVTGEILRAETITAGEYHSCGLSTSGAAYCWGSNGNGQLGDGTVQGRPTPVQVSGGLTFTSIEAGSFHTVALTSTGAAYAWGHNGNGELGDGTATHRAAPVAVSGGHTFASIGAGSNHTVALTSTGAAYGWGYNGEGQLGDGTYTTRRAPVAVSGGLTFTHISAGSSHTVALTSAGAAYAWGYNANGELGDGTNASRTEPVAVSGGRTFTSISAGSNHTAALTSTGAAYTWGYNGIGGLGDGTYTSRNAPVAVSGGLTFTSIAAGGYHTVALSSTGAAYAWGHNGDGELGDGTTTQRTAPVAVSGGLTFTSISAGVFHTLALTSAGAAYAWGHNGDGQLGDGTTDQRNAPAAVSGGVGFQQP